MAIVAVAACSGCKLLDDDEPPTTAGGTDGHNESCQMALEEIDDCEYPFQWWFDSDGGGGKLVLVDDPAARVSVGPNAWLLMISSAADYVGTHDYDNGECHGHCGWCAAGQVPCQGGIPGEVPHCNMCLSYDLPDIGEQCATFTEACLGHDGLDETGGGTTEEIGEYDCTAWRPEKGVRRDGGTFAVDAALIEEALLHQGEPLASCDDTRFRRRSDGYFEISKLGSHGLLAAMGFARGDIILAVDGEPLNNLDTLMQSASRISVAPSFTITFARGGEWLVSHVTVR